jgi:hypothetical protein
MFGPEREKRRESERFLPALMRDSFNRDPEGSA